MHFMTVKKVEIRSGQLCDLFIVKKKTMHLQQLKGMQSSRLVM